MGARLFAPLNRASGTITFPNSRACPVRWNGGKRGATEVSHPKLRRLRQESVRVFEENLVDRFLAVAAAAQFHRGLRHGERVADAPVARAVQPDALGAEHFEDVRRSRGRAF